MTEVLSEQQWNAMESLVEGATTVVVGSRDADGFPNAKQMFKADREGLRTFWFSTNTSSMRVGQFAADPRACLYFCGEVDGLMLVGTMEICQDRASRERLWSEGSEVYYPLGVDDPDYCVLKFQADRGDYYHALKKYVFSVDDYSRQTESAQA